MKKQTQTLMLVVAVIGFLVPASFSSVPTTMGTISKITYGVESANEPPIRFQWLNIGPGFEAARVNVVGKAIDFQNWPKTKERRVAPRINKNLLSNPKLVTRENTSYGVADSEVTRGVLGDGRGAVWSRITNHYLQNSPLNEKSNLWQACLQKSEMIPVSLRDILKENWIGT